ncbi:TonB-dependent receptor [Kangiella geojedonensis]|uniref:TonB-dependent receptor plug n=1 Tax=Kangiella geojedonensis TaxID=914150 RepID=A0A0F6TPW7_9GAMM|nr:TonB-dependent receptor [Kangiella geojedonensis]AKE51494.1 TonB-dependent receptor plug [Kangiella geojedonensis]
MKVKLCTLPFLVTASIAMANDEATDALSSTPNYEVMIIEGQRINLIGSSQSASEGVIGQVELSQRPMLRTGEILETVPGLVVTQHSGSGKANQYFLRGFNLDHGTDFATSIDGMPINMRSHGHGQGYTDLNFIIEEAVKTITYKKGAYYADVGDFSGAGTALISTQNRVEQGFVELTLGEDSYQELTTVNSFQQEDVSWLYAVNVNYYDGPWTDIEEDLKRKNVWLKRSQTFQDLTFDTTLMLYDNSWNSADQIPQRAVEREIIDELGSLDTTVGGNSDRYSLNFQWYTDNFNANVYAIQYGLNLWSNFTYFLDDENNGDQFEQVDERVIYGGSFNYTLPFNNSFLTHQFGAEARYDDIDEVGLYKTQDRQRLGVVRSDTIGQLSLGAFYEATMNWTSTLKSVVGVRYDYYDFDVSSLPESNVNGVNLTHNDGQDTDDLLSAKASLIYSINSEWETYLSAGQGFHSNDARGVTGKVDPATGQPIDSVDPLVRSLGYELGIRGFITDRLNTSLSLWTLDLDSELLFVGDAGNTEANGATERYGLELTAYYRIDDTWSLDMEYAYTDAQYSNVAVGEGDHVPGAIEHVLQAGISANFANGWFMNTRIRYFGERPLEETGKITSDSSTLANFRLGFRQDNWSFKADILNAFDSNDHDIDYYYASRLSSESSGVATEDVHYHVLEPRTVRLSATYHF